MRKVLIFIIISFILTGCGSKADGETNNHAINYHSGTVSVAGCITEVGGTIFLMNQSDEMLVSSNKIDMNELIVGKSYRLSYTQILESNPPTIIVEDYNEINKDYCD